MGPRWSWFGLVLIAAAAVFAVALLGNKQDYGEIKGINTRPTVAGLFDDVVWNWRSTGCLLLTFTISALANAAGVGGGGFLVPLFNFVLGVKLKEAMALSQAAITGGAVAAGTFALFNRHPLDDSKPLLDLDLALVLLPNLLLGVTIGVEANELAPSWLLVVVLVCLLSVMSVRTLYNGMRMHAAELQSSNDDELSEEEDRATLLLAASSEIPSLSPKAPRHHHRQESVAEEAPPLREGPLMPATPAASQPPNVLPSPNGDSPDQALPSTELPAGEENGLQISSFPVAMTSSNPSSLASSPRSMRDPQDVLERALAIERSMEASRKLEGGNDAEAGSRHPNRAAEWVEGTSQDGGFHFQSPFAGHQSRTAAAGSVQRHSPFRFAVKLVLCVLIWAIFLGLQLLKGRYLSCTVPFFAIYGAQAAFCVIVTVTALGVWVLHRRSYVRPDLETPLLPSPRPATMIPVSAVKLILAAASTLLGGAVSALCGLGGGIILGPVLLELGVHPLATAATSLLLVGSSSSSAAVEFALANRLDYGWGIIILAVCSMASIVGVAVISRLVRARGRASIIVFLLFVIMVTGGVLTAVLGGMEAYKEIRSGGRIGFISLCDI